MSTVLDTPDAIAAFQHLSRYHALRLEVLGLRFKGGSVCALVKREYGITARKKVDVLEEFGKQLREAGVLRNER